MIFLTCKIQARYLTRASGNRVQSDYLHLHSEAFSTNAQGIQKAWFHFPSTTDYNTTLPNNNGVITNLIAQRGAHEPNWTDLEWFYFSIVLSLNLYFIEKFCNIITYIPVNYTRGVRFENGKNKVKWQHGGCKYC